MKKIFLTLLSIFVVSTNVNSQTWNGINTGVAQVLNSVHFANATNGWAVGNANTVVATTDGGNVWTPQVSGLSSIVVWNGVYFTSATNGCIVGPQSMLCTTTNGGSTWTQVNSGTAYGLNAVRFYSSTVGFAVGNGGVIIRTVDGGATWLTMVAGAVANTTLRSVFFANGSTGWVAGDNGLIKKTLDNGNTWSVLTTGTTQNLRDIHFISATQGWAVGANGTIITTTNGGASWTAQTSGTTQTLNNIHFVSATQAWIVGGSGTILTTTNGGATWTTQSPPSMPFPALYGLHMSSSTMGWAVGGSNIKFCAAPSQPGTISGSTTVCASSSQTYSVAAVAGATSYTWVLPSGWIGTSTTNTITATVGTTLGFGSVSVRANNGTCESPTRFANITINASPSQPSAISGSATPCTATSQTYSVSAVSGASSYTWTLPSGWTGTSTTNTIICSVSSTSGNISVKANNSNGCSSILRTLAVTTNSTPLTPGTINGSATTCSSTSQTYSVTAVAGATSYAWTLPSGWSGTSTTNTISAIAGSTSGNISVTASNTCGTSSSSTKAVAVNTTPSAPGIISGNSTICSSTSQTYSITAVAGATSYTWALPSGWNGVSTTNSITATSGSSSGTISVMATNSCGNSSTQTLNVTVNSAPTSPSSISGASTACSGLTQTYSVTSVPSATSYSWNLPSGWSGTSSTNSINVTLGTNSGSISVQAVNSCGTSSSTSIPVAIQTAPVSPNIILGNNSVCSGTTETYSVTIDPTATSYVWTLPNGWSGTSTTNSIIVNTGTSAGGTISVAATNTCGSSVATNTFVDEYMTPTVFSNDVTICDGSAADLEASADFGTINWYAVQMNGTSLATGPNYTTPVLSNNTTYYAEANNNGCINSPRFAVNVMVNPMPTVNVTNAANTLTVDQAGAIVYQWLDCNNANAPIVGENNQSYTPSNNGSYAVEVNLNGCVATSSCEAVNTIGLSKSNDELSGAIYPNPNTGSFTIQLKNQIDKGTVEIVNMLGEIVYSNSFEEQNIISLNLNEKQGVYFARIKDKNNKLFIIKMIIE